MKVLLFGTGDYYNRYKKWFVKREIVALIDNSEQKQHTVIDGMEVLPPEEGVKLDYDIVVILSFYVKQMKRQLISLGVEKDRIYHFYDLHELLLKDRRKRPVQYYLGAEKIAETAPGMKKILLLSNELTLGGPPIALFHAAVVLKNRGYEIVYASMMDGPLKEKILKEDIPIVIDENLQVSTMAETSWMRTFSLVLCNTLNFHVFLSDRDTRIPIIWWLHDAEFFYDGVRRKVIETISFDNLRVVSVGPVPETAIKKFLPGLQCGRLLYGVADAMVHREETGFEDFCGCKSDAGAFDIVSFATIGFLEDIKGQDVLIHAIQSLPDAVRRRCRFYIAGHDKTLFGEKIHRESLDMDEIIFTGSLSRSKVHGLLNGTDVLICPSRQDSMPTVAAEAMMHAVMCILSDSTGTAAYIHDGEDGFIFENENAQTLAEKIEWCVVNKEKLADMGEKARKLYEKYFSMTVFENRFLEIVRDTLEQQITEREWKRIQKISL